MAAVHLKFNYSGFIMIKTMEILLLTAFLFVSMAAHANYQNTPQDIHSLSTSDSSAQSELSVTTEATLNHRYEAVSATAAALMIPGCNNGSSAQTESGGLGLSQRSPSCVYIDGMNSAIAAADFYRRQAKLCPDDPLQQDHLHKMAHASIDEVEYYQGLLKSHAGDRSKTGWIASWFTDTIFPIAITIGLVVMLL